MKQAGMQGVALVISAGFSRLRPVFRKSIELKIWRDDCTYETAWPQFAFHQRWRTAEPAKGALCRSPVQA